MKIQSIFDIVEELWAEVCIEPFLPDGVVFVRKLNEILRRLDEEMHPSSK